MPEATRIVQESCDGCGDCVHACPFFAVDVVEAKAVLAESCTDCGVCAPACPRSAIFVAGAETPAASRGGAGRGVWVWAGGNEPGGLDPDAAAVAAAARAVAEAEGDAVAAVLPWKPSQGVAALAALGVDEAILIPGGESPAVLAAALLAERPRLLLGSAGAGALRALAGAAAVAGIPFAAGSLEVEVTAGGAEFTRPIYGGRFTARLAAATTPAVCTLDRRAYGRPRPGGTEPPLRTLETQAPGGPEGTPAGGQAGALADGRAVAPPGVVERRETVAGEVVEGREMVAGPVAASLAEARLVLAGGTGLAAPGPAATAAFELLARTARALGGAPAADREAVEAGLAGSEWLVDTAAGATIAPDVYLALGVGGSATHNGAVARSKVIVAVTEKEAAPILTVADYIIAAEPLAVLKALAAMAGVEG